MISHSKQAISTTLMWLALCAVLLYSVVGGVALLGWLPMAPPQLSEEVSPAPPSGKARHGTAIAYLGSVTAVSAGVKLSAEMPAEG